MVLDLANQSINFGLKLGRDEIPLGSGEAHKQACLKALALYRRQQ
jgi:hypothetical protein